MVRSENGNNNGFDQLLLDSMKRTLIELQEQINPDPDTWTRANKEAGSKELEKRLNKLIEMMVLFILVLQDYEIPSQEHKSNEHQSSEEFSYDEGDEEWLAARELNGSLGFASNCNGIINNVNEEEVPQAGDEGRLMRRWLNKGCEFIRRGLSWPFNWKQTKQIFWYQVVAIFILLALFRTIYIGLTVAFQSYNYGCPSQNFFSNFICKHADLFDLQ